MSRKFSCLLACFKKNLSSLHQTPWVRFAFVKWKMKYISAALGMLVHFIFFIHMLFQTKMMKNKQNKPWDILLWNWKYSRITNKTRLGFSFMNSESFAVKKYFAHRQLWFSIQLPSYNNTSSQPTIWPQIHAQPNWESNWVENIFHFIFLGKMLYFSLWTTLLLVYYLWSLMVWWSWPLS